MSTSPTELEQRAERAVRRGELLAALELFEAVQAQRPEDEQLRLRIEAVRALLQPSELVHRRRQEPELPPPQASEPLTDAEQGELHAASGRFAEATQAYQGALEQNPGNELIRERLDELQKLARPPSRALDDGLASAPRLDDAQPEGRTAAGPGQRSARAAASVFGPESSPARPALPRDPIEMLKALLQRIRGGRRGKSAGA